MGCRAVIEIKLVGWVAGTVRVETHRGDTQNTHKSILYADSWLWLLWLMTEWSISARQVQMRMHGGSASALCVRVCKFTQSRCGMGGGFNMKQCANVETKVQ